MQWINRLIDPLGALLKWATTDPADATIVTAIALIALVVLLGYLRTLGSVDITGKVIEAYLDSWIGSKESPSIVDSRLFVNVRLVNRSDIPMTVTTFDCRIECGANRFDGNWVRYEDSATIPNAKLVTQEPCVDQITMSTMDKYSDLANLASWNHLPLEKHKHRDGWLQFIFTVAEEEINTGTIFVGVLDALDTHHVLEPCSAPWAAPGRVHRC